LNRLSNGVRGLPVYFKANKRYTIVAYGPFDSTKAHSVVLTDNTPLPSAGMARLRFFHGGFGDFETQKLRISIGGATSRLMSYGELPDSASTFEAAPGDGLSMDLLDESGAIIFTQHDVKLTEGKAYTVFFSRGKLGNGFVLTAVSEELDSQP
jgi:hypothetical protein